MTSRIKQAIASVQLFVQRALWDSSRTSSSRRRPRRNGDGAGTTACGKPRRSSCGPRTGSIGLRDDKSPFFKALRPSIPVRPHDAQAERLTGAIRSGRVSSESAAREGEAYKMPIGARSVSWGAACKRVLDRLGAGGRRHRGDHVIQSFTIGACSY